MENQLIPVEPTAILAITPVMDSATAMARLKEFQSFINSYLKEDEDFGKIPGTPKPTLYKSGADKLCEIYGMADDYIVTQRVENWDMVPPLFDYEIKCVLTSRRDQSLVGSGMGSCSSYEGKYRWRNAQKKCPNCGVAAIIKGQAQYGGGWLCFAKKDGCGSKFKDGDPVIENQEVGRVPNDDIATLKNTILKMAKKRAKIDAVLGVTRSSGIFTQDIEDIKGQEPEAVTVKAEEVKEPPKHSGVVADQKPVKESSNTTQSTAQNTVQPAEATSQPAQPKQDRELTKGEKEKFMALAKTNGYEINDIGDYCTKVLKGQITAKSLPQAMDYFSKKKVTNGK